MTTRVGFAEPGGASRIERLTQGHLLGAARAKTSKAELIVSLFDECPYAAENDEIDYRCVKNGRTPLDVQRYFCKGCCKQFTSIAETVYDLKNIPHIRMDRIRHKPRLTREPQASVVHQHEHKKQRSIPDFKLFEVLRGCQDSAVLRDDARIEETYF